MFRHHSEKAMRKDVLYFLDKYCFVDRIFVYQQVDRNIVKGFEIQRKK